MTPIRALLLALGVAALLVPASGGGRLAAQVSGGPSTHREPTFLQQHGKSVRQNATACQVCHARESCLECHRGMPSVAEGFATAASGRAMNVTVRRRAPANHTPDFVARHGNPASASPQTCAACHVRQDCLDCHQPDAAKARGFHPAGFLAGHPAQAYTRQSSCIDCHNTGQFCTDCHRQAGLVTGGRTLTRGFHDAKQGFLGGHGQAARQSLESCVSCHVENDCLTCHRQFKPHGKGFDGERLREKNPEMCSTCHGTSIPGGP